MLKGCGKREMENYDDTSEYEVVIRRFDGDFRFKTQKIEDAEGKFLHTQITEEVHEWKQFKVDESLTILVTVNDKEKKVYVGTIGWRGGRIARRGYEVCEVCGQEYSDVWETSDTLWRKVTSKKEGLMCMRCFAVVAGALEISVHWKCIERRKPQGGKR